MDKAKSTTYSEDSKPEANPNGFLVSETLEERVEVLQKMVNAKFSTHLYDCKMDDLIMDYNDWETIEQGYMRLIRIDTIVKEVFDHLGLSPLKYHDKEILNDLCVKLNEDPVLQEIRDSQIEEKIIGEETINLPLLRVQRMALIPGSPIQVKKTTKGGHTRSVIDFIPPKKAYHEISVLHAEDINTRFSSPEKERNEAKKEEERFEIKLKNIQKIDEDIQEIVNKSLAALDSRREKETEADEILNKKIEHDRREKEQELKRNHIERLFTQMEQEYENHKLEFANRFLKEIRTLAKSEDYKEQKLFLEAKMEENKVLMSDIDSMYKIMLKVVAEIEDEDGYMIEKARKNATIKYKNLSGGAVSLKLEATVDVPLFNILALNYEADGYSKWTPFCRDAKLIKRLGRASNAVWLKWDLPPPVSSREGYVIGCGFDRLEINGSVILIAKTIHKDLDIIERYGIDIPTKSKYVKMEIPYIGTELRPITENQTKLKMVCTFDPQIRFVPLSLTSWIARKGAIYLLDNMVKTAANLEADTWKLYLERNKGFYDWLRNLIDNYFKNNKSK